MLTENTDRGTGAIKFVGIIEATYHEPMVTIVY